MLSMPSGSIVAGARCSAASRAFGIQHATIVSTCCVPGLIVTLPCFAYAGDGGLPGGPYQRRSSTTGSGVLSPSGISSTDHVIPIPANDATAASLAAFG